MDRTSLLEVADELMSRESDRRAGGRVTHTWAIDLPSAYEIQDETLTRRISAGESLVGVKLGLTSVAKQKRMGVDAPFVAWLTDRMSLPMGAPVPIAELIQPRVEPELAFVMARALEGPGVTAAQAMAAVGSVHAAVEVIDSRYVNFDFSAADVIADNASAARFVISPHGVPVESVNLELQTVIVESSGHPIDSATGAAIMGHPGEALALAANVLAQRGRRIEAGHVVLSGGLTDAYSLSAHPFTSFDFAALGSIFLRGTHHAAS